MKQGRQALSPARRAAIRPHHAQSAYQFFGVLAHGGGRLCFQFTPEQVFEFPILPQCGSRLPDRDVEAHQIEVRFFTEGIGI